MTSIDWAARWGEGRIGFHQRSVNDLLARHAAGAWGAKPGRLLVPLCGKSLDMVYLAERGAEVVGVEYVEQAVREFFAERGVEPAVEPGPLPRFSSGPYTLLAADFFAVGPQELGPLDGAFDRAALVALDAATRIRYARRLGELLPAGAPLLLIAFDYEQSEMEGPPYAVAADEVEALFAADFAIEHLETREALDGRFRDRGLSSMREAAYLLTRTG